jgi:uncharacterized membrane protein
MSNLTRKFGIAGIFLVLSYSVFFLINIWTNIFDGEVFFKLSITYLVISVALLLFYLILRELGEESKIKKDKYMN